MENESDLKRWPSGYINTISRWPMQIRLREGHVAATHKSSGARTGVGAFVLLSTVAGVPLLTACWAIAPRIGFNPLLLTALLFFGVFVIAIINAIRTHRAPEWEVFSILDSGALQVRVHGMGSIDIDEYIFDPRCDAVALTKVHHRLQPNWPNTNTFGINPKCITWVLSLVAQHDYSNFRPLVHRPVQRRAFVSQDKYKTKVVATRMEMAQFGKELADTLHIQFVETEDYTLFPSSPSEDSEATIVS